MVGTPISKEITAAPPAPAKRAPKSAPTEATGNDPKADPNPPPAPEAKAPSKAKAAKPAKGMAVAPENAPDTSVANQIEFEKAIRDIEASYEPKPVQEGNAEKDKEKAAALKAAEQAKAKEKEKELDPLEAEMAAAEALANGETEVAKAPEGDAEKDKEKEDEIEAPDSETDKDAFEKWINSLSKPAAHKIQQQRKAIAKLNETAAARVVLTPTIDAPLSHVRSTEELAHEEKYWNDMLDKSDSGQAFTVTGPDGKKLELDPEVEEDAKTITQLKQWARAAIKAIPATEKRLTTRAESKPWDAAEKLAPGIISDKDSFAQKKALEILKRNPSLARENDYEVTLAHMARSMQMEEDAKPADGYPKGKAKWVRIPLDKEGKAIVPKKAAAAENGNRKQPPTASDAPFKGSAGSAGKGNVSVQEATARYEKEPTEENYRTLMKASLAA